VEKSTRKFGALQVGKILSNGETIKPGKNYWKGLLESLAYGLRPGSWLLVGRYVIMSYVASVNQAL